MPLLFVYGTLKRGDVRSGALAGQGFVGTAETFPQYRLFDCGDYPGLVEVGSGGRSIAGEVYQVSWECLSRLDLIEGVDEHLYARRSVSLQPPYEQRSVEAYFYLPDVTGLTDCGSSWERR